MSIPMVYGRTRVQLTDDEARVLNDIRTEKRPWAMPERKSPEMTGELWELYGVLKRLVYKGQLAFDIMFDARCILFYTTESTMNMNQIRWLADDATLSAEIIGENQKK